MTHYNDCRPHCSIGYITPRDKLLDRNADVFALGMRNSIRQDNDEHSAVFGVNTMPFSASVAFASANFTCLP